MSREIKFRVWDTDSQKWIKYLSYCIDDFSTNRKEWHKVMQYTGLKDKNGVEIYEGDIISVAATIYRDHDEIEYTHTGYVEFSVDQMGYVYRQSDVVWGSFINYNEIDRRVDIESIEVIGNIYQNPELCQQKEKR